MPFGLLVEDQICPVRPPVQADCHSFQRALAFVPVSEAEVTSIRQAAAMCDVSPFVVRRWISQGLLAEPPWTLEQLHAVREAQDPSPRPQAPHGTTARWNDGCSCAVCRGAHSDIARVRKRTKAHERLPADVRRQLLDAIYEGQPFRTVIRDFGLTSNQVWGLARVDQEWSTSLETALMATRPDDLTHSTNAAYVAGGLRMQRVPGTSAHPNGQESTGLRIHDRDALRVAGR
jgi:hypothetical protein